MTQSCAVNVRAPASVGLADRAAAHAEDVTAVLTPAGDRLVVSARSPSFSRTCLGAVTRFARAWHLGIFVAGLGARRLAANRDRAESEHARDRRVTLLASSRDVRARTTSFQRQDVY